jgi:hypothetical protein
MKTYAITAMAVLCLGVWGSAARADLTIEIAAGNTLDTHAGYEMTMSEPPFPGVVYFVFEDAGMIRAYAYRLVGDPNWTVLSGEQYLCPAASMSINDSWRFIDSGLSETVATVAAQEIVDTDAGSFSSFRVDIERVDDPGTVRESIWFSAGVGMVQERDYTDDSVPGDWQMELIDHTVAGGSGYFPLAVGNTWMYKETLLPVASTTWGSIKSTYR